MIERYYNLFDPAKHYTQLLFRAGDGLQSRELNEIQTTLIHRLQGVADALLKDGDIVSGANLQIDADTGLVTLEAGRVYLRGAVREVPAASFTVPTSGRIAVGVRFTTRTVTELEDPNLREPAVGVRNYQEPGAGRLQETLAWGWEGAGTSDGQPGDFHAVYALDNGLLENRRQPPVLDGVIASLARYDYDANGHYVTEGLGVRFLSTDTDAQEHIFSVAEGRANIDGFKVERTQSQRLRLPIDPDLQRVSSEPQVFNDSGDGSMVVTINRPPLAQVLDIKVTQQKTETVAHGAFTGSRDVLTEPTVVAVLEVKQGGTTYAQGTDYKVRLRKVYPEVRSGQFRADFTFLGDHPENIRSGQTYYLHLELGQPTEAVIIPRGSFYQTTGGAWIYVLAPEGDKAYKRPIRIGRQNPQYYEVLDGLEPGERVIVSGYENYGSNDVLILNK